MRLFVFAIFAGFAIVMFVVGLRQFIQQRRLLANPQRVEVAIIESRVQEFINTSNSDSRNEVTSYRPIVRFQYRIDHKTYESDLIQPSEVESDLGTMSAAREVIAPYPVGAIVDAYYAAALPGKAYLSPKSSTAPIVFMALLPVIAGAAWFLTGLAFK
jgi:hypothetical protein